MSLAKAVANAAAMLVLKAKNVAQVAEDTVLQNRVIAAATQCALSTSQLVACAKVSPERGGQDSSSFLDTAQLWRAGQTSVACWSVGGEVAAAARQAFTDQVPCARLLTPPAWVCFAAGGQPHHQLPGVSGAAD